MQGQGKFLTFFSVAVVLVVVLNAITNVDAAYRKPPFNGSIFGKRSEFDAASKTFSAMCEIASEACQAWFPVQEK